MVENINLSVIYKNIFGDKTCRKLAQFEGALIGWNKKFSLTSVPDKEIFDKLIAPSAWLGMEYAKEDVGIVADFGSGAGIPGAVMAIVDQNNRYHLYDSNKKKIGFLRYCLTIPGLIEGGSATALAIRVTPDSEVEPADRLVARAAGEMAEVIALWKGKIRAGGLADFFKGDDAEEEIDRLVGAYPAAVCEILERPHWFGKLRIVRVMGLF